MRFLEYYNLNRKTFNYCVKVSSIIFIIAALLIWVAVYFKTGNKENIYIEIFASVFLGLSLGLMIGVLGVLSEYRRSKQLFDFFDNTPNEIIEEFGLSLKKRIVDYRFNFLSYYIEFSKNKQVLRLDLYSPRKEVWMTLPIKSINTKDLKSFNSRYRKQNIVITNTNMVKTFKLKKWLKLKSVDVYKEIDLLKNIADQEGFLD